MKEMHESVSRQHDLEKSELKKMYDDHDTEKTRQEKELRDEIEALKFLILMSFFRVLHLISRESLTFSSRACVRARSASLVFIM